MKQKVHQLITHPFVSGSAIVFIGSNASNLFHFIFNFFMVRNLTPASFGDISALVSLMAIATTPASATIPMIINFAARYYAKNEIAHIRGLFFTLSKLLYSIGFGLFIIFILFSSWIGLFFNIHNSLLIYLTGLIVFMGYIATTHSGLLQAKLAFNFISITNLIGAIVKVVIGVLLVFLGWGAVGAMMAYMLSGAVTYSLSFIQLRFIFDIKIKREPISFMKLFTYGGPAAISMYTITSFLTTDILLVKHFFNPQQAGIYAVISLAGKVIFFFTAPIATVLFPLVTQRHEKKERYSDIILLAIIFVLLPSVGITILYYIFPEVILLLFNQQAYSKEISPYLGIFGIFSTMYSLLFVLTNFFLSIGKTRICIPLVIGAILQAGLIWIFHANFFEVIYISITVIALLLLWFLLYYWKLHEKKK